MNLEVKKVTMYASHGGAKRWQASLNGEVVATAALKTECESQALHALHAAYSVRMEPPAMAACQDGSWLVAALSEPNVVCLYHYGADGRRCQGSSMSRLGIGAWGAKCTLQQYADYHALMHDGVDYDEAERQVLAKSIRRNTQDGGSGVAA